MLTETTIKQNGGSMFVRIPAQYVEYFNVKPGKCKIEDMNENEAKLIFKKWG